MKRTLTTGLPSVMDYDDDGNLTKDGPWDYVWDADGARECADGAPQSGVPGAKRRVRKAGARWATDEQNRLTAMTMKSGLPTGMIRKRLEFVYDYLGRRVQKKVLNNWTGISGTTVTHLKYVYDGHNLIAELNASTTTKTVLSTYVWGLDLSGTIQGAGGVGGLLMVKEGSKTYFPAYDDNGNVSALLDSTDGSLDAKYEYGAFGEPLRVGGTAIAADNPFRFSTKYTDVESGLVYYGFRYYSPSLGRFLNRDPFGEEGGTNLYAFVENDPVNGWDYLGLDDELLCDPADYSAGLCDDDGRHHEPERRGFFKRIGDFFGNAGRAISSIGQGLVEGVSNVGRDVVNIVSNVGVRIDGEDIPVLGEFVVREDQIPELKERKRRQKSQSDEQEPFIRIEGNGDENDFIIIGDPDSTHVVMKLGPVGEVKVMGINNVETEILKEKVKVNIEVKRLELAGSLRFGVQRRGQEFFEKVLNIDYILKPTEYKDNFLNKNIDRKTFFRDSGYYPGGSGENRGLKVFYNYDLNVRVVGEWDKVNP